MRLYKRLDCTRGRQLGPAALPCDDDVPWGMSRCEVAVLIRPRKGDFFYDTRDDISMMEVDIRVAIEEGADGIVFGCLK